MNKLLEYRKFFSCITLFLVLTLQVKSQDSLKYDIRWTKTLKFPTNQDLNILKMDSSFILYHSTANINANFFSLLNSQKPIIYRLDRKTNDLLEKPLILKNGTTRRSFEKIIYLNDTIHLISSFVNTKQKKYYLFTETINQRTLEFNNDLKKLVEIDYSNYLNVDESYFMTYCTVTDERIIIHSILNSKASQQHFFNIFDTHLNEKSQIEFMKLGKNSIELFQCDKDYNLYIVEWALNTTNNKYERTIYFCSNDRMTVKSQAIISDFRLLTSNCFINEDNQLVINGVYTKPNLNSASGAYTVIVPALLSGKAVISSCEFGKELIAKGLKGRDLENTLNQLIKNEDFNDKCTYYTDDFHRWENGDFAFITEQKKIEMFRSGNNSDYYTFTYKDIYVCMCRKDGSFKWIQKVPKYQDLYQTHYHVGHYLSSFGSDHSVNLIYNEFPESDYRKNAKTILVRIDSTGNEQKNILFSSSEWAIRFSPFYSQSIDENHFIITKLPPTLAKLTYTLGEMVLFE